MSSGIASKTEVGGTIYGVIKKLVGGLMRCECRRHEPVSVSGGTLTKEILKSEVSQCPEMQSNSLAE